MHRSRHILLAQEPADGGGQGAPLSTQPSTPAQGQGAAGVTLEQIKSLLDGHTAELKNGVFADLRRAGVFDGKKGGEVEKSKPQPVAIKDEDSVRQMMSRQRAFDRATARANLSDRALSRMEKSFTAEAPDDVAVWVSTYLEDLGIGASGASSPPRTEPSPAAATQPPQASNAPAAQGAPPAPPAPAPIPLADLERAKVHPNKLTADQVARMGPQGTLEYVNKFFKSQAP